MTCLCFFCAEKMSHIRSLVNKANQKVNGQSSGSRKQDEQRERTTKAWFSVRVHHDPKEEQDVPLKRKKICSADKSKQVQTPALPLGTFIVGDGLFQLPKVWSESGSFDSQASLILSDPELKVIRDLGVAGRTRAVTKGVISAMKAFEVAVYMNNSSTEEAVSSDALAQDKEVMTKRIT